MKGKIYEPSRKLVKLLLLKNFLSLLGLCCPKNNKVTVNTPLPTALNHGFISENVFFSTTWVTKYVMSISVRDSEQKLN